MIVSAGYDLMADDPLAGIEVTFEGLKRLVRGILSSSRVPMVFALEGGYHLQTPAKSVELTLKEMLEL